MVGKTNMDQFAAGLVGTRSPFGVPRNAFDARFVPGGSSSGSGALVGAGLLPFALGTDTAGSGKRPRLHDVCNSGSSGHWHDVHPCTVTTRQVCTRRRSAA